jgi:hypothetical protein
LQILFSSIILLFLGSVSKFLFHRPHPFTDGVNYESAGSCKVALDLIFPPFISSKIININAIRILWIFGDIPAGTMEFIPVTG